MDTVTRRRFLIASGVTGGVALATGSGLVTWHELSQRAVSDPQPVGSKILVLVTLYGGNDGINTLVPYADPAYHDARPELAYAEGEVLRLDASVGLNPAMKGMATLWREGRLAVVRGVGYPRPDHSHFRSMDIWQTASPDAPVNTGWIGRWLDATGDDPVRAVNIGAVLPPLAVGANSSAAALPLGHEARLPADLETALRGLGTPDPSDSAAEALVRASFRAERTAAATFATVLDPKAVQPDHDQRRCGRIGRRTAESQGSARRRRAVHQGRRADVGIRGEPWRIRHPCRREGHPADATWRFGLGAQRLPPGHGRGSPWPWRGRARLLRIRPPSQGKRVAGHRPRHGRPGIRRRAPGQRRASTVLRRHFRTWTTEI